MTTPTLTPSAVALDGLHNIYWNENVVRPDRAAHPAIELAHTRIAKTVAGGGFGLGCQYGVRHPRLGQDRTGNHEMHTPTTDWSATMENEKSQLDRFKEAAGELEADDDEAEFNAEPRDIVTPEKKICPECGHVFKGNGWDGIDAHWKSKHKNVMPYAEAWPLLRSGRY